ncbi:MAG: ribbon-helix-helix protein, CopG family [Actinobacteria bacterium]|nr:ribbon-helix-helix protein, CopG family [Actinomycetota bacterium]
MLASDAVAIRRTTVAAESDDLAVLEHEARRRGVTLTQILREAVEHEAGRLRRAATPRFGIVRGDGTATESIARDEHAPARGTGCS